MKDQCPHCSAWATKDAGHCQDWSFEQPDNTDRSFAIIAIPDPLTGNWDRYHESITSG